VQTGEISCGDNATCAIGTWTVETTITGEPWLGAHQMTQDLVRSWKRIFFDVRHPADTVAGPGRINYPVPSGHGTHAHVGNGEVDGWISIEPPNQQSADIVNHEYGHVVMSNLWTNFSPVWPTSDCPSSHFINLVSGSGCALSEGFADFWAWYSNQFYDGDNSTTNDGGIFNFPGGGSNNMETRDGGNFQTGDRVEGNVAGALGDLLDSANESPTQGPLDRVSDGIKHIWHVVYSQSDNNFSEWWTAYWSTFAHEPCPPLNALRLNTIQYSLSQCPACNGLQPTIFGTSGNNTISGTAGRDIINGLAGADTISGLGGNDVICGGGGNDTLNGGGGNDTLIGGGGTDTCNGGTGTDSAASCETVNGVP
jgi:Ca2+-binding RTX toxin-like protein